MVTPSQGFEVSSVNVPLGGRSYSIQISSGASDGFAASIRSALGDVSHVLVIADEAVDQPWAESVSAALAASGEEASPIRVSRTTVASGEPSKSIAEMDRLLQWVLQKGGDRRSVIVAVGGGVIGDLAGFIAASFARGIRFVQVPTTLLAMVDSSVGGKTGINLPGAKNMVGAFWQPSLVLIDTDVLSTLSQRSYLSGLAEVIKYGVIDDAEFFAELEDQATALVARKPAALRHAISRSCQSKASVVGEDERETSGRRAILNYGHTFAHAIEATAGYGKFLHGEAVAIGMQMAARLAVDLGMCDPSLLDRQTRLIQACCLPTTWADADPDAMLPVMMRDKKVAHGKLRFILPTKIGAVEMVGDVDEAAVRAAIVKLKS
ncbi:3-dehydroquinate synthase [Rubripirellula lacrimiformis]|uniref:3-dehydroquinate synthase n=1 Tax=Rubripirellula lacrimiformis TaxID=1930273 RepID=A0A517NA62_9BACT|nr:3-dehydroquinate synthase [Rubripirellula lacrimiformis]QDT04023.1 3-dehydroquinate synthase [Rubripirellula lacrimiformis]